MGHSTVIFYGHCTYFHYGISKNCCAAPSRVLVIAEGLKITNLVMKLDYRLYNWRKILKYCKVHTHTHTHTHECMRIVNLRLLNIMNRNYTRTPEFRSYFLQNKIVSHYEYQRLNLVQRNILPSLSRIMFTVNELRRRRKKGPFSTETGDIYRVIQEERSIFWEVNTICHSEINIHTNISNSEWLQKYRCLNLQTFLRYIFNCWVQ